MIKFFRKIRQKLVHENRVGKYLLYAVGEIILVIIGILIALSLNKANEAKTQEKKVEAILRQIQDELVTTIEKSNQLIELYRNKDSLINLVINHKVSITDFKKPDNVALRFLNTSYDVLIIQHEGFNSLMLKSEILSDKYTALVNGLKRLYIRTKEDVEFYNKNLEDLVFTATKHQSANYDWFAELNYSLEVIPDNALDYFLNDFNYRNSLVEYSNLAVPFTGEIISARIAAINHIREIDSLLNLDNTYSFDYNVNDYAAWLGKYHADGDTIHIYADENGLSRLQKSVGEPRKLYPLSASKFHLPSNYFFAFNKDEQGEILGHTASRGSYRRFWGKIK